MYDSDYHRKELWKHPSLYTRFVVFARKKWSVILHHTLLLGFGYALVVVSNGSAKFCECTNICGIQYPGIRSGKCDFIIGTFFLRELWNPFQNLAKLLKQVSMYIEYLWYVCWNGETYLVMCRHLELCVWKLQSLSIATHGGLLVLFLERSVANSGATVCACAELAAGHPPIHCTEPQLGLAQCIQQSLYCLCGLHWGVAGTGDILVLADPTTSCLGFQEEEEEDTIMV